MEETKTHPCAFCGEPVLMTVDNELSIESPDTPEIKAVKEYCHVACWESSRESL